MNKSVYLELMALTFPRVLGVFAKSIAIFNFHAVMTPLVGKIQSRIRIFNKENLPLVPPSANEVAGG